MPWETPDRHGAVDKNGGAATESGLAILVGFQNDYFAKNGILRGVVEEPNRVDEVLHNSLEFIREDECVEVTPKNVRIRKLILDGNERDKASRRPRVHVEV